MNAHTHLPIQTEPGLSTFLFDGHPIRVLNEGGEPLIVGADLCAAIDLTNPSMALKALDEVERPKRNLGRQGLAIMVTEAGMYALLLRSKKATVKGSTAWRFRRWTTQEVLPTIRRTGAYAPAPAPVPLQLDMRDPRQLTAVAAQLVQLLNEEQVAHAETHAHLEQETRLRQIESRRAETAGKALVVANQRIEEQAPKAEAFDAVVAKGDAMSVTDAANVLGVGRAELFAFMRDRDGRVPWLYVLPGTTDERPFRYRVRMKHLKPRIVTIPRSDGTVQHRHQPLVTPLGLAALRRDFPLWAAARARVADREPRLDGI